MSLSTIKQTIENIDYAWTNPLSYTVLIPGLSLIIQKIQFDKLLPLNDNITATSQRTPPKQQSLLVPAGGI